MPSKFRRGAYAFTAKGQRYVVEAIEDGIVYCSADSGAETEFREAALMTEAEWMARSGGKSDLVYQRLRQSKLYAAMPPKVDRAAAETVIAKAERLMPGILDFAAFTTAARILADTNDEASDSELSIAKCRELFNAAKPETRLGLLASVLGAKADILAGAGQLGDNLMRAMLAKGIESQSASFEDFVSRRRR
jgi:hypothetical protein